jgi:cysteine desulfurase
MNDEEENMIYLDYNASTPIDKETADAMLPYLYGIYGNPSGSHFYAAEAQQAIVKARNQVAELLACSPEEIIFTSGGTESNNLAVKGIAFSGRGNHIITSSIEHPAITEVCKYLETGGFEVTYLPVNEYGLINTGDLKNAIRKDTCLITIMHANNEVGTIQPIKEIAEIASENNIIFHTDAAQSVGKIMINVKDIGVDLLSVAGHKIYAPKGVGALYVKSGTKLIKQTHGANHERNIRPGTENVLEIVGLGKACEIAKRDFDKNTENMKLMRDKLQAIIFREIPNVQLNGHPEKRLANTLNLGFRDIQANDLLLEMIDVAASPGAACHSDITEISQVLLAMNVPEEYALGAIRFSTGKNTTEEEIVAAVGFLKKAYKIVKL